VRRGPRNLIYVVGAIGLALAIVGSTASATVGNRPHRAPSVWSGEALEVQGTYVVLSGTVDPHHQVTTYWFELGQTTSYGIRPQLAIEHWLVDRREEADEAIPRLRPHTTYHFRLVAHNRSGTTYGKDKTVTTLRRNTG
jgi:hypothetical protein